MKTIIYNSKTSQKRGEWKKNRKNSTNWADNLWECPKSMKQPGS